jgi:hypothetical protein
VAERGEGSQEGEIERRAAARRRRDEVGEGLPVPGDAHVEDVEWNGFDIDQVAHGDLARPGPARRDADAAVPMMTLVTPCHDEGVTAPSQQIWAS